MKDQHTLIKGYRDLSQEEIDLMNEIKSEGERLGNLIVKLEELESSDKEWVQVAKKKLQLGVMAAVRSVAKPNSF